MRWAQLRTVPVSQRWLRAVVGLGPVVALLAAGPAGEPPPLWLVVVVSALAVLFALTPDSGAGIAVMFAVLAWWGRAPEVLLHPSCLLAAAALLASHLAGLVAGYGPVATTLDPAVRRLWLRRAALVLPAAPVLWGLALLLREGDHPAALWPAGLVTAIAVAVATTVLLGRSAAPSGAR